MYPGVELRLYRYAVVLAEVLNFTHAAMRLHVSQSTLTGQIQELEQELGVLLFNRTKGGKAMSLTAAGEAFAAEARLTLFHAERAIEAARAANTLHKGPWRLGYSPLIDLKILSKVRQHLGTAHPAVEVRLVSAHTSEQVDALLRGKLQAGLVILPMSEEGLSYEGLCREAMLLALPEQHPLAAKMSIEINDLQDLPLLSIRGDIEPHFGNYLRRRFRLARVKPRIIHQATTQAEALEILLETGIPALTMSWAQNPPRKNVVFRKLPHDVLSVETGLAYLPEQKSAILSSLRKHLLKTFHPLARGSDRDEPDPQLNLFPEA